ncbi:MAG: type II secretion system protein [Ruminococcaceae bacterium]|nr:type II secretion system protein [Oscillospiraceae bacterium]
MRRRNNKGFTLAELLIVVAIIAVLTAIAIPVFTTQLERSREATDLSNIRAAYAEAVTDYLVNGEEVTKTVSQIKQKDPQWNIEHVLTTRIDGVEENITLGPVTVGGSASVKITPPTGTSSKPTVAVTFAEGTTTSG